MSNASAEERQQIDGELSAEVLAVLKELSEKEITTGIVEAVDLEQLPDCLFEVWTVEQVEEVFAEGIPCVSLRRHLD